MNVFKLSYKKLLGLGGLGIRGIRVPMNYLNCRMGSLGLGGLGFP